MMPHSDISKLALHRKIANGKITFAGNTQLKIYGTLACRSGKRMLNNNRVFFENKAEAVQLGYRPCGHCLVIEYRTWKTVIK